jgi:hypothetical protein
MHGNNATTTWILFTNTCHIQGWVCYPNPQPGRPELSRLLINTNPLIRQEEKREKTSIRCCNEAYDSALRK